MSNSGLIRDAILKKSVAVKRSVMKGGRSPPSPFESIHKENTREKFHFK